MKLSFSSMSKYWSCPLQWKIRYIDKVPEKPKSYFSLGRAVHAALEFMHQFDEMPDLESCLGALNRAWSDAGFKDEAAIRKGKREAEAAVRVMYVAEAPRFVRALFTEYRFDLAFGHVRVTGVIDRIDHDGSIVDYKTGREIEPGRALTDDQLTMYQAALRQIPGMPAVTKLAFIHAPTGKWEESGPRTPEQLDAFEVKVANTADAIARGEVEPKPSEDACRLCDYKSLCPVWKP